MATPSLRHGRRLSPPYAPEPQLPPWRPTDVPLSSFRRGPVLPQIASLLNSRRDRKELPQHLTGESRKRRLPLQLDAQQTPPNNRPPIVMYVPQTTDEQLRARRRPWDHHTPLAASPNDAIPVVSSATRRPVYRELHAEPREEEMAFDPLPTRRLYFHHSGDPHKSHEVHAPAETHPFREAQAGKHEPHSRYYEAKTPRPVYYDQEQEQLQVAALKRRRVAPSPVARPRQPLYEAEYGLAVLETSKPLMRARYSPTMGTTAGALPAARRRYVRADSSGFEKVGPLTPAAHRISYSGGARMRSLVSNAPPPAPAQVNAEIRELSPSTELKLKYEAFTKSKRVVRNRYDEIEWVPTFLNVGFDSAGIFPLICPLRKGRWKSEEENYTMGLLKLIENGTILLRHGQSIRGYVGERLNSDDMRVLKKLSNCKMFHFAKLINPRLAEEEKLDTNVTDAKEGLKHLEQLKREFLRSVQLEAIVAVQRYQSDSSLRDLLNVRA